MPSSSAVLTRSRIRRRRRPPRQLILFAAMLLLFLAWLAESVAKIAQGDSVFLVVGFGALCLIVVWHEMFSRLLDAFRNDRYVSTMDRNTERTATVFIIVGWSFLILIWLGILHS